MSPNTCNMMESSCGATGQTTTATSPGQWSDTSNPERAKAREAKAKESADALWQLYATEPSLEPEST